MLVNVNMSDDAYDLARFKDTSDFETFLGPLDGIELLSFNNTKKEELFRVVPQKRINGFHTSFPAIWYAFWTENEAELMEEFGTLDSVERYYGSTNPQILVNNLCAQLKKAREYNAHYAVIHACECSATELLSFRYKHSDDEVLEAFAGLLNKALNKDGDTSLPLMLENLWYPGLQLTNPQAAALFMKEITAPVAGIMLDTGHLLHTNFYLKSPEEGLSYINKYLDALDSYDGLCSKIKGMHLNQSITGDYCLEILNHPPLIEKNFEKRLMKSNIHAYTVDQHKPFLCEGVKALIESLPLQYLTFEYITESREQLEQYLQAQLSALNLR